MVKSILDPSIIYQETKNIDKEDKHYDAQVYEISLFSSLPSSTAVNIVLGQPKYTFVDKKVVYYPIYLIINDKVSTQIGVYEVPLDDLPKILDADGDIDLELLNEPLLFAFTTPEEIKRLQNPLRMSTVQSEETALKEREDFKKNSKPLWIQKFMENNNYKIVDNEGKGECLFAVIRDGLKGQSNKDVTVDQMREMLAKEVDEDLYTNYLTLYKNAKEQDQTYAEELKGLVQRNKDLKEKLQKEKDRNKQMAIITQAEEVAARHKLLSEDKKWTRAMITEFDFMKAVKNIGDLKAKIQTCEFWGNTWAISTLERILRIKLILLSEENYKAGDIDNVLQCGQLNDDKLGENFEPTHYILACYQGWHYQLITYKGKGALNFNEIPYDIKMLIASKCLERLAGPYYIIPAFRDFMEEIKEKKTPTKDSSSSSSPSSLITSLTSFSAASFTEKTLEEISKELSEEIQSPSDLYDNKTTFQFYSKSLDKALPGHGVGEKISGEEEKNGAYKELSKIKSWRRKLANEWNEAPFKLDGQVWQSVEQYYEASKYKKDHRDIYAQYSLAKEPQLLTKGIRIDKDFFMPIVSSSSVVEGDSNGNKKIKRSEKELEDALRAKFTQNPDLMLLLKATKKAKLQQFKRSAPPIICEELMRIRTTF